MDKLIHTALNSLHSARLRQMVSSQNLANAQVTGFRGDEIGGRFGSVYLSAERQHETRVFTKKSEPGLFSTKQGELRQTGQQTDVAINGDGYYIIEDPKGEMGLSRRGDFTMSMNGELLNGAGEKFGYKFERNKITTMAKNFCLGKWSNFIQPWGLSREHVFLLIKLVLLLVKIWI